MSDSSVTLELFFFAVVVFCLFACELIIRTVSELIDSGGGRYWKCLTDWWFWASLEPLMGETNCSQVLNPPKLVGLIAPINAENRSQQCRCLFPSPTIGSFHPILALKERLFLTLSNPWTNKLPHNQYYTQMHTPFLQNTIHAPRRNYPSIHCVCVYNICTVFSGL